MPDEHTWDDHPVCPPCLLARDHRACDGGRFWCECGHPLCLDVPPLGPEEQFVTSTDYWLLNQLCPACRPPACDHAHCDPDRTDCPSLLCECVSPLDIPEQRSTDG